MWLLLTSPLMIKAQVPFLSSHPSATAVVFLDFDGHNVDGTSWNYNGPIACGGSGLNNSQITEIFNRIAEDYRPFNINITTDSTKFLAAPSNKRIRVILTVSSSWYGSAGGVAFVGSFAWGDDNPCFVFTALLNNNVKFIAEAAAHEAGHTLGLYHQASYDANCLKLTDYYAGTGAGEIGWAPIMGVGYYRNLTLWNNGPNSYGCANFQSDLDIITSATNGFGYRTDDHPNTFADATIAHFSNNQFTTEGVVERNTDNDMFKFIMSSNGRFQLDAIPYNVGTGNTGSDLDLQVTLYNSSQNQINVYNPGTLLSSVIDTTLNPGTYYVKVEGKGNAFAPNYASLGSYSLRGQAEPGAVLPLRKLELRGYMDGDNHQLGWVIDADEAILEQFLEISTDGRNFQPLTQSPVNDRAYIYRPVNISTALYRLKVIFETGRQYYSNVVNIRQSANLPRPQLMSTLVNGNSIAVSSPGRFQYSLFDLQGKQVMKGQLTNGINHIDATRLTSGMFLIQFADNTQQWTEKFVRQ
jgi:hypothetical protein